MLVKTLLDSLYVVTNILGSLTYSNANLPFLRVIMMPIVSL